MSSKLNEALIEEDLTQMHKTKIKRTKTTG